jgi:hypothetical protein
MHGPKGAHIVASEVYTFDEAEVVVTESMVEAGRAGARGGAAAAVVAVVGEDPVGEQA